MYCFGPKTPDMGGLCRRLCACLLGLIAWVIVILLIGWFCLWCAEHLLAAGLSLGIVLPFVAIGEALRPKVERMKEDTQ